MPGRQSTETRAFAGLFLLGALTGACVPGKFDDLTSREGRQTDTALDAAKPDASHDGAVADARVVPDAGPGAPDALVDAADPDLVQDGGDSDTPGDASVDTGCPVSATQLVAVSKPVAELGRLAPSPVQKARVLGPMVRLGATDHVWTFSSAQRAPGVSVPPATPNNHPSIAFDGNQQPWNRVVTAPWTLRTRTLDSALPPTMLPLFDGESTMSSLVPTSLIRLGSEPRSQLYALEYDINITPVRVWRASIDDDAVQAQRRATPLFTSPPFFTIAARADGEFVHVYACQRPVGDVPSKCFAGRVPTAMIDQASAYQVRVQETDGSWTWSHDLRSGTAVLENVAENDLTVSYNSYLRKFLAVYGEPLANHVVLRTSPAPFGPWSEPVRVPLPAPSAAANQGFREHAPIAQSCERRLVITYFAPTAAVGIYPTDGDIVMAGIDLD